MVPPYAQQYRRFDKKWYTTRVFVARRRLLVVIAVLVVVFGVFAGVAWRTRTPGCGAARPVPPLDQRLRALGGFDQPVDGGRQDQLADAAERAAAATGVDLASASAGRAVVVEAGRDGLADAVVAPLLRRAPDQSGARVVGLVAFYKDCSGNAYFGGVDNLAHNASSATLPTEFPSVAAATAQERLGAQLPPRLVYVDSAFRPMWRDDASARSVAAT